MRPLFAVLLFVACATPRAVSVDAVTLDFPARDRGALKFELLLPDDAGEPGAVTWSLFIEGSRFASGVESPIVTADGVVLVQTALLTHHLSWREGAEDLEVAVQGQVQTSKRGLLRFQLRSAVPVHGRPVLTLPIE